MCATGATLSHQNADFECSRCTDPILVLAASSDRGNIYGVRRQLVKNLSTVSTSAPAARLRVESNMLMPEHLRYGDLDEAAGAADAVGLWGLHGRFDACSCRR
jgi:hypothetical protein